MNLELTKKENEIVERTFGSIVSLDNNFNVVEDLAPIYASYLLRPRPTDTVEDFKKTIVEMRTAMANIRMDANSFQFPILSDSYLDSRRPFNDYNHALTYVKYNLGPSYIKITAIKYNKATKTKLDIMGSFAYVRNEMGVKIIIPVVSDILQHGVEKDYELGPKYSFILGGNNGTEVLLKRPRKIRHTNLIVCDIEYKNGGPK